MRVSKALSLCVTYVHLPAGAKAFLERYEVANFLLLFLRTENSLKGYLFYCLQVLSKAVFT